MKPFRVAGSLSLFLFLTFILSLWQVPSVASADVSPLAVIEPGLRAGTEGDSDGDGLDDVVDIDDDNDTLTDVQEGTGDTDGDGVADCLDRDSDNDGIPDLIEAVADRNLLDRLDSDGDGQLDARVALGNNGLADLAETDPDSGQSVTGGNDPDLDSLFDQQDLDADNDGLPDVIEAGAADADANGVLDRFRDIDGDGLSDQLALFPLAIPDTDADGIFDFRDLDSDQDGLTDLLEWSGQDADGDGRLDRFTDTDGNGLDDDYGPDTPSAPDSNADGVPDHLDEGTQGSGNGNESDVTTGGGAGAGTDTTAGTDPGTDTGAATEGNPETVPITIGQEGSGLGGCSIGVGGAVDPVLTLLAVLAVGMLLYRRLTSPAANVGSLRALIRRFWVSHLSAPLLRVSVRCLLGGGMLGFLLAGAGCAGLGDRSGNAGVREAHLRQSYAGVGFGISKFDIDTEGAGVDVDDDVDTSTQLTLGVRQGRYALEGRIADLGEATFKGTSETLGFQVADITGLLSLRGNAVEPFVRLGVGALFDSGDIETDVRNRIHLLVGGGLDVPVGKRWSLRAEVSAHDVDATQASVNVLYRFGAGTSAEPTRPVVIAPERQTESASTPAVVLPESAAEPDIRTSGKAAASDGSRPEPTTEPAADSDRDDATANDSDDTASVGMSAPPDQDADGVVDTQDRCVDTRSGTRVDAQGCLLFGGPVSGISFTGTTDQLEPSSETVLQQVLAALEADESLRLTVASHAFDFPEASANLLLSRRRTLTVIRWLTDRGIAVTRVRPQAFGSTMPLADASTDDSVAHSNRLELFLR